MTPLGVALDRVRQALPASPLARLSTVFQLSPFELDVLLLAAGVELDASVAAVVAALHEKPDPHPTFSLALGALPGAHWSAITPSSPLRHWQLLDADFSRGLTTTPLRIDERVLHYLTGVGAPDSRLAGIVEPVAAAEPLAASHRVLAERIAGLWSRRGEPPLTIQLSGDVAWAKLGIACAACALLDARLALMYAETIPAEPRAMVALARLWEREARLTGSALFLDLGELDLSDTARNTVVLRFVEMIHSPVVLVCRERRRLPRRPLVSLDVPRPTSEEQAHAWRTALADHAGALDGTVDRLVAQFQLGPPAITAAAAEAMQCAATPSGLSGALWSACRMQARPRLDDLAQRIEPAATWDDLVLSEGARATLRDVAAQVRQRSTVYERWGFGRVGGRGLGISALFAGASGTGKTTAAEVLAHELALDLYRIDLSAVVSKYIGETEKNLRRVFDVAEEAGAVLLFDEADALFGKRSEVKDSHDRYANIEVSYLLQRMECYRGLAILTTNMKSALDNAFLRRIRFVVQFPFPDPAQRADIWQRVFPRATPVHALRPERLAQLDVAGGNIRNIAVNAAFLAADDGEPVSMHHVLEAARSEYAKIEKPLTAAETAGWLP